MTITAADMATTTTASEAARAVNALMGFSSGDQDALLEVTSAHQMVQKGMSLTMISTMTMELKNHYKVMVKLI